MRPNWREGRDKKGLVEIKESEKVKIQYWNKNLQWKEKREVKGIKKEIKDKFEILSSNAEERTK